MLSHVSAQGQKMTGKGESQIQYLSRLLGDKRSGQLKALNVEVEQHLHSVHSDPRREEELEHHRATMGSPAGRRSMTSLERPGEELHQGLMVFHTECIRSARG